MNATPIEQLVAAQRQFFASGRTLELAFRKQSLVALKKAILAHEAEINAALMADLGKSATETYMCETGMTLSELSYMLRHLERFAKKRRVLTPLAQFPSSSFTVREPYGVALIMAPWNYPFMLLMEPLIGAHGGGQLLRPQAVGLCSGHVEGHGTDRQPRASRRNMSRWSRAAARRIRRCCISGLITSSSPAA